MTFEEGLLAVLATTTVGSTVSTRIYPVVAPQDAPTPYLVYRVTSGEPFNAHDGDTGVSRLHCQFDVVADTYAVARTVVTALDALNGTANKPLGMLYMVMQPLSASSSEESGPAGRIILRVDMRAISNLE